LNDFVFQGEFENHHQIHVKNTELRRNKHDIDIATFALQRAISAQVVPALQHRSVFKSLRLKPQPAILICTCIKNRRFAWFMKIDFEIFLKMQGLLSS
jgi:hypothetical protein